jgi:hypothetical protein
MEDKIILALIGIFGGGIGSLFAPWANWGIEKRKQKLAHRRELVAKWREMVAETSKQIGVDVELYIHSHKDYFSLLPHLKSGGAKARMKLISETMQRPYVITPALVYILEEIARIERKWDLV